MNSKPASSSFLASSILSAIAVQYLSSSSNSTSYMHINELVIQRDLVTSSHVGREKRFVLVQHGRFNNRIRSLGLEECDQCLLPMNSSMKSGLNFRE